MKRQSINVRSLAEFALEGGDLRPMLHLADRMQDGMKGHKILQDGYPEGYKSEIFVKLETEVLGIPLFVQGRIDGLQLLDVPLIEEIKTTAGDPMYIRENDYPVHWAQAEIYAHMVCEEHAFKKAQVQLCYFNLSGKRNTYRREFSARQLRERFFAYATPYAQWLKSINAWQSLSLPTLSALAFPFQDYRDGQREMIDTVYEAIAEKQNLLCQAPTGIGKTAGALFPAIKALGEGKLERIFYLTARTTTRAIAEATIERMRSDGLRLRSLTLTAKDKVCLHPGERCSPETCVRARGYFDKRREALNEALLIERLTREVIENLAAKHDLCPFELSLDLAEISDVVICDYNHAFDPRVKLKRFFLDKGNYALLVDEAHNLIDRSRDMLSSTLSQKHFVHLRHEATRYIGKSHPLIDALDNMSASLAKLRDQYEEPAMEQNPPQSLQKAALRFTEEAQKLLSEPFGTLVDVFFEALDYLRTLEQYDETYRTLIDPNPENARLKLWCYNAAPYLSECLSRVRSGVLFSATLSPMHYYFNALGLSKQSSHMLDLPSPFPPENLLALQLDLSTRFTQREQTAGQIAAAILAMCRAKVGNYLACFPSHAYLNQVRLLLESAGDVRILSQRANMSEAERTRFLAQFKEGQSRSMLALIAMGGVFSEGIDLPGELLSGAAIVGIGMPGIGFEREMLRQLADEFDDEGYLYAYIYPGIERVLQAAGRVIRTETDMGVVLLLDDRYQVPEIQALLPAHWQVESAANHREACALLGQFWDGERQS